MPTATYHKSFQYKTQRGIVHSMKSRSLKEKLNVGFSKAQTDPYPTDESIETSARKTESVDAKFEHCVLSGFIVFSPDGIRGRADGTKRFP